MGEQYIHIFASALYISGHPIELIGVNDNGTSS